MEYKDYYELLGVDKTADAQTIKRAYRRLAKQYHPDLHPDDRQAQERFKQITEAYEVLGDETKRRKYDAFGANYEFVGGEQFDPSAYGFDFGGVGMGRGGYTFSGASQSGDFSDFFNMIFGAADSGRMASGFSDSRFASSFSGAPGSERRERDRSADVIKRITLSPWAAYLGTKKRLKTPDGTLNVRIPRGVRPGQRIRISGRGRRRGDGSRGDLFLEVVIDNPSTLTQEQLERYRAWAGADLEE